MSALHRHEPELFDFTPAREEPLEVAGPDEDDTLDLLAAGSDRSLITDWEAKFDDIA